MHRGTKRGLQPRIIQAFQPDQTPGRTNRIRTNKYQWYSFLPKNAYEQFSQAGNLYFLAIALLQLIPAISNTGGRPLTLIPLSVVLAVGAIKDFFEDFQCAKSDRKANERETLTVTAPGCGGASRQKRCWADLTPGTVIVLRDGEEVPADALVLHSTAADGSCSVETMNLDGETNLKRKIAVLTEVDFSRVLAGLPLQVEAQAPSADMYSFVGALRWQRSNSSEQEVRGVGMSSLLLRGTSVQGTSEVYALVCYCGHETRVMKNAQATRMKLSALDIKVSHMVLRIFLCQLLLSVFLSAIAVGWEYLRGWKHAYLMIDGAHHARFISIWGTWVLQTNSLVPISLMVTMTGLKYLQGCFVRDDHRLRGGESNQGAEVHCSQVIESLGQVTHVFSDKTGTLTKNCMEYRACSVRGKLYGLDAVCPPELKDNSRAEQVADHVRFAASVFRRDLADPELGPRLACFLLCHAACHTVTTATSKLGYNAASPDELALVCTARALGLEFVGMSEGRIEVKVKEKLLGSALQKVCGWEGGVGLLHLELMDLCEFDNDRKRMSTIVRGPDGRLLLFTKGADSSILDHLHPDTDVLTLEDHLLAFAETGLRTLCLSYRELQEDEYQDWHSRYERAQAEVSVDRARLVQTLSIELETSGPLNLLGATAIEDRLQDQVPETLEQLCDAGIAVWVLTGDKMETAVSIAHACRLILPDTHNLILSDPTPEGVWAELESVKEQQEQVVGSDFALTVCGTSLGILLAEPTQRRELFGVASRCRTVLACRVSPKQKAEVVALVKDFHPQAVTLSIGDGANDVSMIVQAHIGVGLAGKEGAQAAQAADFAISEFRLLRRLLFVHGRESFRRNALVVFYNFYKNQLGVFPQVLFALHSAFSARFLFHPGLQQLYNIFFTHLPICLYGLFDRAAPDLKELEFDPRNWAPAHLFSNQTASRWVLAAVVQAVFIYIMIYTATDSLRASGNGQDVSDLYTVGILGYGWVIICANLTMARQFSCWFVFTWPSLMFGVSSYLTAVGLCAQSDLTGFPGVLHVLTVFEAPRVLFGTLLLAVGHVLLGELSLGTQVADASRSSAAGQDAPVDDEGSGVGSDARSSTTVEMTELPSSASLLRHNSPAGSAGNPLASSKPAEGVSWHHVRRSSTQASSSCSRNSSAAALAQSSFMFSLGMSQECAVERDGQGSFSVIPRSEGLDQEEPATLSADP